MKYEGNFIKYIFFAVIIALLILAMYIISFNDHKLAVDFEEKAKEEKIKDWISIGITNFDTMNPLLTKNKDVQHILKLVYKSLLDVSNDFKIKSSLAEEYSKLDSKTYIIKLKDNIYWHDGEKFTSEDVFFTINALKESWKKSIYYENIKDIESIFLIDDTTLKIYLKEEVPFFEYKLVLPILPKHQYDENYNMIGESLSGTGEYSIKSIADESIILRNNNAKTKDIKIIIYDRNSEMFSAFEKMKLDLIITSNINYERYIGTIGYKSITVPDRKFYYIQINQNNYFLKDRNLRTAINKAINKREIIYTIYKGKYKELNFPKLDSLNEEYKDYEPKVASKILEDENYILKKDNIYKNNRKVVLNLSVNSESTNEVKLSEMIKENLKEIGISINIVKLSKLNYEYNLKNNYFDLILTNSILCLEPKYNEYFRFNSDKINNLINEIEVIDNEKIKEKKIEELKKIKEEEMPFIGLYVNTNTLLINSNLKGDFQANWYNIFYNIDTWYAVKN